MGKMALTSSGPKTTVSSSTQWRDRATECRRLFRYLELKLQVNWRTCGVYISYMHGPRRTIIITSATYGGALETGASKVCQHMFRARSLPWNPGTLESLQLFSDSEQWALSLTGSHTEVGTVVVSTFPQCPVSCDFRASAISDPSRSALGQRTTTIRELYLSEPYLPTYTLSQGTKHPIACLESSDVQRLHSRRSRGSPRNAERRS